VGIFTEQEHEEKLFNTGGTRGKVSKVKVSSNVAAFFSAT
jgi:hypothetical protein